MSRSTSPGRRGTSSGDRSSNAPFRDTLRFNDEAYAGVTSYLDQLSESNLEKVDRQEIRYPYRPAYLVKMKVMQPCGGVNYLLVRPRNLSVQGLGILHGGFLHPGTLCELELQTLSGETQRVKGKVRHCKLFTRHVHIIGICLREPLVLSEYLAPEVIEAFEQQAAPSQPTARLLCIEADSEQVDVLKKKMQEAGVEVIATGDTPEAREYLLSQPFDLVLLGSGMPSMSPREFIESLEEESLVSPLLLWTDEEADWQLDRGLLRLSRQWTEDEWEGLIKPFLKKKSDEPSTAETNH